MNDFTKNELQDINYALTEYGDFESACVENLVGKIQFMIDEYCDHKWLNRDKGRLCDKCARWEPFYL
jgi:hypothetical protein